MDRPTRKTKAVNYSESQNFDDDDEDFACVKAPPSKKAKEDVKQHGYKKPSSASSSQEVDPQTTARSKKSRQPLDDKLYERDLEAALSLSLLHSSEGKDGLPPENKNGNIQREERENQDPSFQHLSNCSVDIGLLGLDKITAEQKTCRAQTGPKYDAAKAKEQRRGCTKVEDEEFQPHFTAESESEEDFSGQSESEDEEFMVKKVKKTSKKDKKTKADTKKEQQSTVSKKERQPLKEGKTSKLLKGKSQTTAVSLKAQSPPGVKVSSLPKRPPTSSKSSTPKSAESPSSGGSKVPAWTPPARIGSSPGPSSQITQARSPGQGLRLGLSRLVRVKPLHPSVTSH